MKFKYSLGFLMASLLQAGIVMATEALGVSTLGAKLTAMQLLIHILVGQVLGYLLLFIINKFKSIYKTNFLAIGSIYGIITWSILLSINSAIGKVKAPWTQGFSTILSSLIAFIAFGIIATYTIKSYYFKKV
jgi:uncharacterized membrane protein YagU involved in acid resistance